MFKLPLRSFQHQVKSFVLRFGVLLLFVSCNSDDQLSDIGVFNGDLFLNTQEAIDDFAKLGYTSIIGDVRIGANNGIESNITSINLTGLTSIQGVLEIANTNLVELNGLSQLVEIQGSLFIRGNPLLQNLDGLDNLSTIDALSIVGNAELQNLNTLSRLRNLSTLIVSDNPKLTSLLGLANITDVALNFTVSRNPFFSSLSGLMSLTTVGGLLEISETDITSLTGLENLRSINEALIQSNNTLLSLAGLTGLETITGELVIRNNPFLDDFCALQEFVTAEGIALPISITDNSDNPTLQEIIDEDCDGN